MTPNLKSYPTYKPSGIEWLGDVPEHWVVERAKWLFQKMERPVREEDEVVTCFRNGVVTLRKNLRELGFTESLKEIGYQGIRCGDLVIHSMDAFAGAIGIADSDGKGTPVYSVCKPKPQVNAYFYAYTLREMARNQWIQALAKGIRERSSDFRYTDFASQPVPFPPLPEQTAIVYYLDHADELIHRYVRGKQKLIRLLEEEKQAIIHRAVTRGLDPNVHLKPSGVEWLGDVPVHWEVMPLRRVAISRCDGPFGSGLKSSHYTDQGIRVVRLQNIGHAQFNNSDSAFIAPSHYATLGDHTVEPEDLLIAGLGDENHPAGRACVAPSFIVPAMVKADCFRFRLLRQRINPAFAALQLTATAGDASSLLSTGATRQRTNLQATAARPIAVPPIEEQSSIVRYLDKAIAAIDTAISHTHCQIELLQEYCTRLIADVVTGKLDVRGAAANLPDEVNAPEPPKTVEELDRGDHV